MTKRLSVAVLLGVIATALPAPAADGWALLRRGMTRGEASSMIGDPLMKNRGRGFELWLYDGGAEIVCYRDVLVAWTVPPAEFRGKYPQIVQTTPPPAPLQPGRARGVSREELRRIYDKFPAFRTEIRL